MIYLLVFFKLLLILVQNPKGGAKPRQNEPNYTRLLLLIKYARKYRRDKIGPPPIYRSKKSFSYHYREEKHIRIITAASLMI